MFHASSRQRDEMRGAVSGDTAFDFCYRSMYLKNLPNTDSPSMGSQDIANFILWLIEENHLPPDLVLHIQEGAQEELATRHKTLQTEKDHEEMWVRWIKQKIHGELESLQTAMASSTWQYSATGHNWLNCAVLGDRRRELGRPVKGMMIIESEKVRN